MERECHEALTLTVTRSTAAAEGCRDGGKNAGFPSASLIALARHKRDLQISLDSPFHDEALPLRNASKAPLVRTALQSLDSSIIQR